MTFRPGFYSLVLTGFFSIFLMASPQKALAQASGCEAGQKLLKDRQGLISRLNGLGKKNVNPNSACSILTQLSTNGSATVKWTESNKDWCQIPDQFVQNIKADHAKTQAIKNQACKVAAQQAQMIKRAKQQAAQQPKQQMFGGDGLTGQYKMPQGAL